MIRCDRLNIVPFEMEYLSHYFNGFNTEITKFQWPDPFESIEDAKAVLQEFLNEMDREETLFFSILSKNDDFLGSVEIHGLVGDCPELGIWIIESEQNKGYAYEALNAVLDYICSKYDKAEFYFEADNRNTGCIKLLRKFEEKYKIIEDGFESLTTASGKFLELQGYILKAKFKQTALSKFEGKKHMNEVLNAIITRRSCKSFKPDMISQQDIDQVIKAGLYAASGLNTQSPIIIAVTDKETRDLLSALNRKFDPRNRPDPFYGAPVVLVVLAPRNIPTYLYDGSLVMGNLMLAAHSLGLGSCWIHRAKETFEEPEGQEILKRLGIRGDYEGIGNCVLGIPATEKINHVPERKENRVYRISG